MAGRGWAGPGMAGEARHCEARTAVYARRGVAGPGMAGRGKVRQSWQGPARSGRVWHDAAWQARHGPARLG